MDDRERIQDTEETIRTLIDGALAHTWTASPGIVQDVDLTRQTLTVQMAIQGQVQDINGDVAHVTIKPLVDVPIVWPRAGGFAITFPIAAGDEVLVVFGSRCIDSWWQNGGVGAQMEARKHDLSDGFAILAPTSQVKKLGGVSTENVQIRNEAGDVYIEMTPGSSPEINITQPTKLNINCATSMNIVAPDVNITGKLTVSGLVTTQTDFAAPNIPSYDNHTHTYIAGVTPNIQTLVPTSGT